MLPELLNSVLTSKMLSWLTSWPQSLFRGRILVDLQAMEPKFPTCCTLSTTKLIQSHLANTEELHLTWNTVLVPVVDQVKLGFWSWILMSWKTLASKWVDMSVLRTST